MVKFFLGEKNINFKIKNKNLDNIWANLAVLKLFQICLEILMEKYFKEILLFNGLSCLFNQVIMFSTLSADSFFDFLFCYFIEVTSMIGERLYLVPSADAIKDDIIEYG
jgi:hypothetical protein